MLYFDSTDNHNCKSAYHKLNELHKKTTGNVSIEIKVLNQETNMYKLFYLIIEDDFNETIRITSESMEQDLIRWEAYGSLTVNCTEYHEFVMYILNSVWS